MITPRYIDVEMGYKDNAVT